MNSPFLLSLRLALTAAPLTVLLALPAAWLLAFRRFPGRFLVETALLLPLVLPPTVLGFYLLLCFGRLGGGLNFTFAGLVAAGVVVGFPLVIQNLKTGMELVPRGMLEASSLLGKGRLETFFRVLLPQIRGHLFASLVLAFARLTGEFGVMLMIGGNIPGRTRLASLALYERVEALDYGGAHRYALMLGLCNAALLVAVLAVRSRGSGVSARPVRM